MTFLNIVEKASGKKVATFMGRNVSHVSEKAYDAGYCRVKYVWEYK